jgi:single-stranded DNA-binding protein
MASVNRVMLMGRLTRDPSLRRLGRPRWRSPSSRLAMSEWTGSKDGERKEKVCFVDIVVPGTARPRPAASTCARACKSSWRASLQMDEWADKQSGEKRTQAARCGRTASTSWARRGQRRRRRTAIAVRRRTRQRSDRSSGRPSGRRQPAVARGSGRPAQPDPFVHQMPPRVAVRSAGVKRQRRAARGETIRISTPRFASARAEARPLARSSTARTATTEATGPRGTACLQVQRERPLATSCG